MRITRIELKNIKSYRDAVVDLQAGVTAIRGHNGAGKSTLLEAIGWALFNALPYNQNQFVREGENSGKVTVSFISSLDDRLYEVVRRCGNGATWYIVDPETGDRRDSTADVQDFLRQHMRVEGSVDLRDLFNSAIGVPQGSLTADFLLTAANRKKRFDTLLQVEDYVEAAKRLGDTANHLKQELATQAVRIEGLEAEVARLDGQREELAAKRAEAQALEEALERSEREATAIEARRENLRAAEREVTQREGESRTAEAKRLAARQSLAQAAGLLEEARTATRAVEESRADHTRYLEVERGRAAAHERQRARDELRARQADAAQRQASAEANARNARQRLDEVERAEREILALQDDAAKQVEIERARDEARQDVERLRETDSALARLAATLTDQRATIDSRAREISEAEAARPEAEALAERQSRVTDLQAALALRQSHEKRRVAIKRERQQNQARREQAEQARARHQENLRRLDDLRPTVERLPELEEAERAAEEAVRRVEATLEQTRRSREQAGAGNCPFLAEPCQNIQRRGENNLRAWFDKRVAEEERTLEPLTERLAEAREEAAHARHVATFEQRRGDYEAQLRQAEATLADCADAEARLNDEEAEITADLAATQDPAALNEARRLLAASQKADRLLATLASLRREMNETRERMEQYERERAQHEERRAALADAPSRLREAEDALVALNDPRGRIAGLRARAAERDKTERLLEAATGMLARLEAELAGLVESLAPYAALDEEIAALEAESARTRPGHTRYLQNERTAAQLAARDQAHAAAVQAEALATREASAAQDALREAQARFDPADLARVSARADELRQERGRAREALRHANEAIAHLSETLERGAALVKELEAAQAERDELTASDAMLKQFREVIKEAGPQVTRALLNQISAQANNIFGDIIGDRAGTLSWVRDYEIVLKRDGVERTFAQLSGGEQMTAALAVRLALLRRLTRLDMAFFDEPTQNMDGERRSALAEQLRRVRGFEQLIVISHDDTFEQGLDGVIHLEKRDGETRVAEGEAVFETAAPLIASVSGLPL